MATITFEKVGLIYHSAESETLALKDISFSAKDGELLGIVGPSGSGKTTILSLIAGLLKPSYGKISIDTASGNGKFKAGYMLQSDQLFGWRSIWKNVMLGLELNGRKRDEASLQYAEELLEKYGIAEFKKSYPRELSGGMRQRVALIRTLVTRPDILLLDEPFSALDFQTRLKVGNDVRAIIKNEGITTVFITHDLSEAISICDRVLVLSARPAVILDDVDLDDMKDLSALERREHARFSALFERIWRELQ